MRRATESKPAVLMIAYTNYRNDPRVIRAAEAAFGAGFDVDFIALRREKDPAVEMVGGVRLIHLAQSRYRGGGLFQYMLSYVEFFIRCFFKTTLLYCKRRYTVVHVNNMPDFFVFCALVPKLFGSKVLLDIHDPMPDTFASKFKRGEKSLAFKVLLWQERLSAWFTDRVLTVSEPLKNQILIKHGHRPESILVVSNFADEEVFKLRDKYSVAGRVRFVFHGTILERYGLADLLVALSKVKNRDRISVRFVGEGDYAASMKQQIIALGLQEIVQFDNRVYPLREIPDVIADCNVGLVPLGSSSIINFALPLKLLEYISLGLPVVTVRSAAIGHYFAEGDCLFYRPDIPSSLPELLDRIAGDPDLLVRFRERALAVREKFLWSNEKKKYIALLRELSNVPHEKPALVAISKA